MDEVSNEEKNMSKTTLSFNILLNGDVEVVSGAGFLGTVPYNGYETELEARESMEAIARGILGCLFGKEVAEKALATAKEAAVKQYHATLVRVGCEGHPSSEWKCEWCEFNGFYREGESTGYTEVDITATSDEEAVRKAHGVAGEGLFLERLEDDSGRVLKIK